MTARRAAVLGHPVGHSLSPVLHRAGFAAAGLDGWTYDAVDCPAGGLAALLGRCGGEWAGFSVTMPLKEEALACADGASATARLAGVANTLVRRGAGWYADNTDVTGMTALLGAGAPASTPRGRPAVAGSGVVTGTVLGAGGTARAALVALGRAGVGEVAVVARRAAAVRALVPVAEAVGVRLRAVAWGEGADHLGADVVVSTVPAGTADGLAAAARWRPGAAYLDALYAPWPTPLAAAAAAAGLAVLSGLDLLYAQALDQFAHFTGLPAPAAAMRAALHAARPAWPATS
ncbi:putative shikimate-5-dehydrogenase (AroE) [Pilimelia terevasa]|uniref:Putative shikimate-5-dehydrogenase (AroE) n=1 Tax=Pilimelia terevasa TaxID=53372 RepID=A0A8J3FJU9_9ACTN|nr:shikimate dehydrogenase [Pilimelia terevasa]GGK25369.1 putative shikimate-5-dehydrogenase (AroE) [Pilimelia terevasa]